MLARVIRRRRPRFKTLPTQMSVLLSLVILWLVFARWTICRPFAWILREENRTDARCVCSHDGRRTPSTRTSWSAWKRTRSTMLWLVSKSCESCPKASIQKARRRNRMMSKLVRNPLAIRKRKPGCSKLCRQMPASSDAACEFVQFLAVASQHGEL